MGKKFNWMRLLLVVASVAVLGGSIAGSVAWLTSEADVTNNFVPGVVGCQVLEEMSGASKTSIRISNMADANVPAYIRVALVPVWRTEDGKGTGKEAVLPAFTLGSGWVKGSDGYYYCTSPVAAGQPTPELLATPITAPENTDGDGYVFEVQVLAQSIQADGVESASGKPVVSTVWTNVTVNANKTLTVR